MQTGVDLKHMIQFRAKGKTSRKDADLGQHEL